MIEPAPWILKRPQGEAWRQGVTRRDPSTNVGKYRTPVIDLGQEYGRIQAVRLLSREIGGRCRTAVWVGREAPEEVPPEGEFRGPDQLGSDRFRYLALRLEFEVDDLEDGEPVRLAVDEIEILLTR